MKQEIFFGLENAAWPSLLVDAGGQVLMCNAAAKALFGASVNGGHGSLNLIWATANGTQPEGFLAWWDRNQRIPIDVQYKVTGAAERKYATVITTANFEGQKNYLLQLLAVPEGPPGAQPKESKTEFRNATSDTALKQKLECVLQLSRTMSLDFNNALTGVLAHTSLLLGKAELNHPWRRSLIEVEKSAARAAEIAAELGQFSRHEKESKRVPAGNLNALVGRCMEAFRNATGSRLTWRFVLERFLYQARYDESKVQQALTKVLENAPEAFGNTASGEVSLTTRNLELTEATQDRNARLTEGTYVCVEIADTGSGIEEATLPRVFEPFFTTKHPPHRGLGLALVYGIVTTYGGAVAVSSQLGKGTSTRIYLPAEKTVVEDSIADEKDLHGRGTILVVDDETLLTTMAEAILSDFGYKVLTANSGRKALEILERPNSEVDLVITDLVMPGMGGRELTERIRALGLQMPVVAMSGYVLPEDKSGQSLYLQKPFTTVDLLRRVKAALAGWALVEH